MTKFSVTTTGDLQGKGYTVPAGVLRYAARVAGKDLAEDAAQEAMLLFARKGAPKHAGQAVIAAKNIAHNVRRADSRAAAHVVLESELEGQTAGALIDEGGFYAIAADLDDLEFGDPERIMLQREAEAERQERIEASLDALPDRARLVARLMLSGHEAGEIAARTGLPGATVRQIISRDIYKRFAAHQ